MHLRASRTLWLLRALTLGNDGIVPQADRPAHQDRVKKVDYFLKNKRIFFWNNSLWAQIRLRMHLRAFRTLWLLGALTSGRDGIVPQADRPAHQERVKRGDCFLKNKRIFIWNDSFRAQIRLRMHLRASRTLCLLVAFSGPQTPSRNVAAPPARSPAHQKRGKNGKLFSQNNRFSSGITHLGLR